MAAFSNPSSRRARTAGLVAPAFVVALPLVLGLALARPAAAAPEEPPASDEVLVAGDPALTEDVVGRTARFLEWILDAPMTAGQREEFRAELIDAWRRNDRKTIQGTLEFLEMREKVFALPEAQRDLVRAQALPPLLEQWRAEAEREPSSKWLLAVHDATHRPLVAGDPPLTRQVSDAYAESLVFAAREITGRPFEADGAFKDAVAERLRGLYPQMAVEGRKALARFPILWAALRTAWPALPEPERQALRRQWATALGIAASGQAVPRQVESALQALGELSRARRTSPLTPDEMRQVAGRMEIVAEYLRSRGTPDETLLAARYEEGARSFRASAAAAEEDEPASRSAFEEAMALQRSRHDTFVGLMNASLTRHVGTMNMIAIMGGSPYRYSVR